MYGGHSLRTGGASFLAKRGVNPFRIQTMGRWTSPLVVHYTADALATGLAQDLRPAKSASVDAKSALVSLVNALELRIKELESVPPPLPQGETWPDEISYVQNVASGCWHYSLARPGWPSEFLRAKCGWAYGFVAHRRQCNMPSGPSSGAIKSCSRCLPEFKETQAACKADGVSDVE